MGLAFTGDGSWGAGRCKKKVQLCSSPVAFPLFMPLSFWLCMPCPPISQTASGAGAVLPMLYNLDSTVLLLGLCCWQGSTYT